MFAGFLGGAFIFVCIRTAGELLSWREIRRRLDTVPTGGYVGGQNLPDEFLLRK
ncbi:hypothetical protein HDF12_001357 [Edaphobacter lichenicola]|uniref:Uncharacterized protein n=1 Tax=Tunturiibacter lichenicola TaxID=2051959 RepID=A0A7Y9NKN6_9BACT|nr:hypothetical protein [Edaphobacter lichenicola]